LVCAAAGTAAASVRTIVAKLSFIAGSCGREDRGITVDDAGKLQGESLGFGIR
jgi:hypothetical protein